MKEKSIKKKEDEDSGIDMLARMMKQGFDRVGKRLDGVDKRLGSLEDGQSSIVQEVLALSRAQDETNRRLTSIERKQTGILSSLDETVTRSEFRLLANKVAALEKKR